MNFFNQPPVQALTRLLATYRRTGVFSFAAAHGYNQAWETLNDLVPTARAARAISAKDCRDMLNAAILLFPVDSLISRLGVAYPVLIDIVEERIHPQPFARLYFAQVLGELMKKQDLLPVLPRLQG